MSVNLAIYKGTLLASRYKVQAFLGEGSFGIVAKCADTLTNTKLAIKIIKDDPFFTKRALEEINTLKQLQILDPDQCHIVRWHGSFLHEKLICLQFELLDLSLHDYMQQRCFQPLSMGEIRPVLHQLTTALLHLEALEIMHADLKPENVMVVDRWQQPLQVKLIDFGLALHVSVAAPGLCVQSLWYRAPEVVLGLVFMQPIDMWSLGLVVGELALGFSLFPATHEFDMMRFIVESLGQPPDYLLNCGQRSRHFFKIQSSYNQQTWKLRMMYFKNKAETKAVRHFMDLFKKMLMVDSNWRITPLEVLQHPFLSVERHTDSSHKMTINNLTVNMAEYNVIQTPC